MTNLADLRTDGGAQADAAVDAAARCDPTKAFATPVVATDLNDPDAGGFAARLTGDELTAFFTKGPVGLRTFGASRANPSDAFGSATMTSGVVGMGTIDAYPSVTADGLTYYVESQVDGGSDFGIFQASRPSTSASFNGLSIVAQINVTGAYDGQPFVAPGGLTNLYFVRGPSSAGPLDIYVAAWSGSEFANAVAVQNINSSANETTPVISFDELTIYFGSTRMDGSTKDIFRATRPSATASFGTPIAVAELNVVGKDDEPTWISPDDCVLYLQSNRDGAGTRIYRATRPP